MPIYMRATGSIGEIKGNVTDKEHKDWIKIDEIEINDHIKDEKGDSTAPMRIGYNLSTNKPM